MEEIQAGSCAAGVAIFAVAAIGSTAFLVASGGTGLALGAWAFSRVVSTAGLINACAN
ncbi:hypothetical protein SAMN06265219_10823 [Gracilimonas mengyeensis]|uniref:Uncharacterized protein n=2 Tax=Gracilimonas mengyeensis TaxID=1302730 RepID=A0A521DC57_9BACT|nr:hypothetical protein SAMN06265219_10823 [Gracilimonas mengyeensis]